VRSILQDGDVPVLGRDHFVYAHILHEELDGSIVILYPGCIERVSL
jgi:hypothetical protein